MSFRLTPARTDDGPAIAAILSDWIEKSPWMPRLHSRDEDRAFAFRLIAAAGVTVVRESRQVTGFMARQGPEIVALYLAPEARGRGIGTRLVRSAQTAENRLSLWTFQANTRARRFYDRAGFREVEATDGAGNDERLPDVRMIWEKLTDG